MPVKAAALLLLLAGCNGFSVCAATTKSDGLVFTEDKDGNDLGLDSLRWDTLDDGDYAECTEGADTGGDGCSSWSVHGAPDGEVTFTATLGSVSDQVSASFEMTDDCPAVVSDLTIKFAFDGMDTGS